MYQVNLVRQPREPFDGMRNPFRLYTLYVHTAYGNFRSGHSFLDSDIMIDFVHLQNLLYKISSLKAISALVGFFFFTIFSKRAVNSLPFLDSKNT